MTAPKKIRNVSNAELTRQITRKLGIAWALVHRESNRLFQTYESRRGAHTARRALTTPALAKVVRVDLRVKGLTA